MSFTRTITFAVENCFSCGVAFGLEGEHQKDLIRTKRNFYCPNGHSQHYLGKTEAAKAREERDAAQRTSVRLQSELDRSRAHSRHLERSKAAVRGWLTRIKRRIAGGICPCCKRPFAAVMRHMRGQHPEFVDQWGLTK